MKDYTNEILKVASDDYTADPIETLRRIRNAFASTLLVHCQVLQKVSKQAGKELDMMDILEKVVGDMEKAIAKKLSEEPSKIARVKTILKAVENESL